MTDFIIIAVIAGCVILSVAYSRKRKKSGQSACGCGCDNCGISSCADRH